METVDRGEGEGWLVECQTCLFVCEVARVTYVTCVFGGSTVFSERGTRDYRKYDMTFFLDQTTLSSFSVSLYQFHLSETFYPAEQPHPTLCSLSDIIITIRWRTSDIWPLSAWEEGIVGVKPSWRSGAVLLEQDELLCIKAWWILNQQRIIKDFFLLCFCVFANSCASVCVPTPACLILMACHFFF